MATQEIPTAQVDRRAARVAARAQAGVMARDAAAVRAAEQRRAELDLAARRAELDRAERAARAVERRERAEERRKVRRERAARRRAARAALARRVTGWVPMVGARMLVVVPIAMPMSVAWVGQIGFAHRVLHWPLAAGIVFAAGFELSTVFVANLAMAARIAGDRAWMLRSVTLALATLAAAMNYWHSAPEWSQPTPAAVSYAAMSLVGIGLWELYAASRHRDEMRRAGRLSAPRPRLGLARWARYPRIAWTAWSLAVRDGYTTAEQAWSAALVEITRRHTDKRTAKRARADKDTPKNQPANETTPTDTGGKTGDKKPGQVRRRFTHKPSAQIEPADRKASGRPREDDGPLMPAARVADADYRARTGRPLISRDALAEALEIGSGRADRIRTALANERATGHGQTGGDDTNTDTP